VLAALMGNEFFRFPLRRIGRGSGHGFGHGLSRFLAFHWLFRHGLWSFLVVTIVVLAVGYALFRWISRRRSNTGAF
jgi:hypothetical protein